MSQDNAPKTILDLDSANFSLNNGIEVGLTDNKTVLDPQSENTARETPVNQAGQVPFGELQSFRGYPARRLPTIGAEADLYFIDNPQVKQVLKLYRFDIEPNEEVFQKTLNISNNYPDRVVKIFESGLDRLETRRWYELMEYAAFGSLADLLVKGNFNQDLVIPIIEQISECLEALHSSDIVHRDIKPSNFLIRSLEPFNLIVADFGISTIMHEVSLKATARHFTPEYASPESLQGAASICGDWWSMGIIVHEILTGRTPYYGLKSPAIETAISTKPVPISTHLSDREKHLLMGLFTRDMDKRWRYQQVKSWLEGQWPEVWYEKELPRPYGETRLAPFVFMEQNYDTLEQLALAMAWSDQSWQAGAAFLARGLVDDMLQRRGQYDAQIALEKLSCFDSNEFVFRFIHRYAKNLEPSYRGLALTIENLYAAFCSKESSSETLTRERDFCERTLNDKWDSLIAFLFNEGIDNIQEDFLNLLCYPIFHKIRVKLHNKNKLMNVLSCALRPDLFYWGTLPKSSLRYNIEFKNGPLENSKIQSMPLMIEYGLRYGFELSGSVPTLAEIEEIGGKEIVLPQSLAAQLADPKTFLKAVVSLNERYIRGHLLKTSNFNKEQYHIDDNYNNIFNGTDEEYDNIVKVLVFNISDENLYILNTCKLGLEHLKIKDLSPEMAEAIIPFINLMQDGKDEITDEKIRICVQLARITNENLLLFYMNKKIRSFFESIKVSWFIYSLLACLLFSIWFLIPKILFTTILLLFFEKLFLIFYPRRVLNRLIRVRDFFRNLITAK
jgi:serine/threonine protein kinase